jgi:hypothetical protein
MTSSSEELGAAKSPVAMTRENGPTPEHRTTTMRPSQHKTICYHEAYIDPHQAARTDIPIIFIITNVRNSKTPRDITKRPAKFCCPDASDIVQWLLRGSFFGPNHARSLKHKLFGRPSKNLLNLRLLIY